MRRRVQASSPCMRMAWRGSWCYLLPDDVLHLRGCPALRGRGEGRGQQLRTEPVDVGLKSPARQDRPAGRREGSVTKQRPRFWERAWLGPTQRHQAGWLAGWLLTGWLRTSVSLIRCATGPSLDRDMRHASHSR